MFWVWLVVIQLFIFTMLVLFLRVLLTRNVTSATAHLHELNQDYNEKLEEANKKKVEVDRYYDELLLKAKVDVEKQRLSILTEAHNTEEAVIKDARRQGEEIIANANRAAEVAASEVTARVEERASGRAVELMAQVLTNQINEHLHALWVKELLKTGFDDVEKLHLPEGVEKILVQTAFPLTPEQKNLIQKRFHAILGKDVPVEEEIKPDLIAGLRVTLGSLEIDGSLQFKIKEVARNAR
jgi:hypothetical protein